MIENKIPWRDSKKGKKAWEESDLKEKHWRENYLEGAKKLGESLNATLVGVWIPRPGKQGDPAVYKRTDGSFFRILGAKDEVASRDDPEEIRKSRKIHVFGKPEILDQYAIRTFDLEKKIREGILFYTPEGYIEDKRYNPESDQPISQVQGKMPSPTI